MVRRRGVGGRIDSLTLQKAKVMRRRELLRSIALTPLVGSLGVASPALEANAATHYLDAVAKLPPRSEANDALVKDESKTRLDAAAKSFVDRSAPALEALRVGASIPRCDWGDRWTTSKAFDSAPDLFMDGRRLARVALLRARFAFRDEQVRVGVDLNVNAMIFGRHVAQGKVLIAQIFGLNIEQSALIATAVELPRITVDDLHYLSKRLDALPDLVSIRDVVMGERAFFLGYWVPNGDPKPSESDIKKYMKLSDRLAQVCDDPAGLASLSDDYKNEPDYTGLIEGLIGLSENAIPNIKVRRAMLRAAIAIVERDPTAIDRVVDPIDGKPFDVRRWSTGFELTSHFAMKDKPKTSLIVGTR